MAKKYLRLVNGEFIEVEEKPPQLFDEIEVDESKIDLHGLIALGDRVRYFAQDKPNPQYYADCWLKVSSSDSQFIQDKLSSEVGDSSSFLNMPIEVQNIIKERKNPELLSFRLLQAVNIFEPLILIESGYRRLKSGSDIKPIGYISGRESLFKVFKRDILSYRKHLRNKQLLDHLVNYAQALPLCGKKMRKNNQNGITMSQYAFLLMVLAALSGHIREQAEFDSKSYLNKIKNGKMTKVAIHTLSRIIYGLILEHINEKWRHKNNKAYCRGITAKIVTAFSPKKESGEPYYSIDERGVEYALSGK